MKRLLFALGLFFCAVNAGAQTTTFNGVVKDLTNTPVPTGQVTFQLKPGIDTTISGSSRFVPATTFCEIHNPAVVSTSGTGTITVVVNPTQNWQVGDSLIFVGTADATLNASSVASPYTITGGSGTTFTFTQSGAHVNGAGGTVGGLYKSGGTGACAVMQNTALTPQNTSYSVGIQAIFAQPSSFNTYAIGAGPVDISTVVPTPSQMPSYSFVDTFSTQTVAGPKTISNPCTIAGMIYVTSSGCYTTLAAALIFAPTTGAEILMPPGGYPCPGALQSHLHLVGYVPGVSAATITAAVNLQWGNPVADQKTVISCPAGLTVAGGASSLVDLTIEGITLDCGGNSVSCLVIQNGVFESHFGTSSGKLVIQNAGTGTGLTLLGGTVAGQSVNSNDFDLSIFNVGKGVVFNTTNSSTNAADNKFHYLHIHNASIRAIDFVQFSDSNRFEHTFISGMPNAANGIVFNSGTPGSDTAVFGNVFEHCLCGDAANPGSYTGTLVTVNKVVHPNVILDWEVGPGITGGGGTILSNPTGFPFIAQFTTDITSTNDAKLIGIVGIHDSTNTALMGVTQKKGTVAGNYTTSSVTFAAVDGTNLSKAVTIPVGWNLAIQSSGSMAQTTAAATMAVALFDGTCNVGTILHAELINPTATAQWLTFSLGTVITGDGAAHTINLCYDTSNGADAANMLNTAGQGFPTMTFTLIPST